MRRPRGIHERFAGGVDGRNNLQERLALRVDDTEHGSDRLVPRSEVITSIAGVEPHFIAPGDTLDHLFDAARLGIHDDGDGRGRIRIARTPCTARSVEDDAATEQQILFWTECQSSRLAELDRKQSLDATGTV